MKLKVLVASLILASSAVFAATIPEGRTLLPLVWDFATDYENSFKEASLVKADTINNEYVIKGYNVNKNLIGFIKQSYTVTIKGEGKDFSVSVSDMTSVSCNKNGEVLPNSTVLPNPKSTWSKVASLMEKELDSRINGWTDAEYKEKYEQLKNPELVYILGRDSSALVFKKMMNEFFAVGSDIETSFIVTSVDESKKAGYAYKIWCLYLDLGSVLNSSNHFTIYTNNDAALSLNKDDTYNVKGKIDKLSFDPLGVKNQIFVDITE